MLYNLGSMSAIRDFFFPATSAPKTSDVEAALTPVQVQDAVYAILQGSTTVSRKLAMSVPSGNSIYVIIWLG